MVRFVGLSGSRLLTLMGVAPGMAPNPDEVATTSVAADDPVAKENFEEWLDFFGVMVNVFSLANNCFMDRNNFCALEASRSRTSSLVALLPPSSDDRCLDTTKGFNYHRPMTTLSYK